LKNLSDQSGFTRENDLKGEFLWNISKISQPIRMDFFKNFNPQVLIKPGCEKGLPGILVDLLY